MTTLTCPVCGDTFTTRAGQNRKFCTNACRVEQQQQEVAYRLAEFEHIAGTDTWDNIATRLGFARRNALLAWLRSHGQHTWAERINADTLHERQPQKQWAA